MTVYVDDMRRRHGHLVMSHMLADTAAELHAMAQAIGVARHWFEDDHYDVCQAMKAKALQLGAVACTRRQAVALRRAFRMGKNRNIGHFDL